MTAATRSAHDRSSVWLAALCFVLLLILGVLVRRDAFLAADTRSILAVRSFASPGLTQVMLVASFIAGRLAIPCALLIAAALYLKGQGADAAVYAVACLSGELLMVLIKEIVHHHRPIGISPKLTDAGWYSFPSGHAMLAVIIFGFGAFLLTRVSALAVRVGAVTVAALFVVLVGLSRVYLGAHWPSDVAGAVLAGLGWSAIARSYSLAYTSRPRRIART